MSFFSYFSLNNIRLFLKVAGTKVYDSVIKPLLIFVLQQAKQRAIELATVAVAEVAADPNIISDEQKRKEAFARIKARAKAEGHDLKDSVINFAIEAAITALKEKGLG